MCFFECTCCVFHINFIHTDCSLSLFNNSIGSAVLLRASLAIISDFIMFQNNRANQGAALKIVDGSSVSSLGSSYLFNIIFELHSHVCMGSTVQ